MNTVTKKGVIHIKDAIVLLETGYPCDLRVWKLSTGDILEYHGVTCIGCHWRKGTHRIKLPESQLVREFRDVTLFEINNMTIYR
ncbi:MAG: hypothetical protein IJT30_08700 [Muribaculaceae bacterium]|nr:hypothetical protein [Muribaculaceae bacterium]